jgi:hypothetical protein
MMFNIRINFRRSAAALCLAAAMLVSAPLFVMLNATLHGRPPAVHNAAAPRIAVPGQTTVIYKSDQSSKSSAELSS